MLHLPDITGTLVCIAVANFVVLTHPAVAQGANTTLPLTYPQQVLQGDGNQICPSEEQQMIARSEVRNAIQRLLNESVIPLLQATQLPTEPISEPTTQPLTTQLPTTQLPTTQPPTTQPTTVTGYSCGGSTGWRRVAYLNMSDPSQQCPSVWQEITTPHRVCGRRSTSGSCEGLTYSTGSEQYDQVCGRIIGYQIGTPDAFFYGPSRSINSVYVEGVSVTRGSPRQHIWTFAGVHDEQSTYPGETCPCGTGEHCWKSCSFICGPELLLWDRHNSIQWPKWYFLAKRWSPVGWTGVWSH